ncbi:hypothetical protein [Streptomyces longispororuber]|uniref:hypothetical protein n=1 Tax=Streptomyces longispororuber TaxID=68230 RepID=UPI0021089443|nr:hypothetical protein [Streptomyces longispororuber]MCQ4208343.1 hypothetical protein [Streptomyces longispororuber]
MSEAIRWSPDLRGDAWVTYARGLTPSQLLARLPQGAIPVALGEQGGWAYAVEEAAAGTARGDDVSGPAITASADGAELLFFETRSWDPPAQFTYARGGRCVTSFGLGCGGEEDERSGDADVLAASLRVAGIIGDDRSRYEADEEFNMEGEVTIEVILDHFDAPRPPFAPTS